MNEVYHRAEVGIRLNEEERSDLSAIRPSLALDRMFNKKDTSGTSASGGNYSPPTAWKKYLSDVQTLAPLPWQEQIELAVKAKAGDIQSRDRLIGHTQWLVMKLACHKGYADRGFEPGDLVGYGNIGLLMAIEKFDETRGFRFVTMASWWIKQQIRRNIQDLGKTIRIPIHAQDAMRAMAKSEYPLAEAEVFFLRQSPHDSTTPLTTFEKCNILNHMQGCFSLDSVNPCSTTAKAYVDTIADECGTNPEAEYIHAERIQHIVDIIKQECYPTEQYVIMRRFGLDGNPWEGLETIAARWRPKPVSKERIRQIERRGIQKVQHALGVPVTGRIGGKEFKKTKRYRQAKEHRMDDMHEGFISFAGILNQEA